MYSVFYTIFETENPWFRSYTFSDISSRSIWRDEPILWFVLFLFRFTCTYMRHIWRHFEVSHKEHWKASNPPRKIFGGNVTSACSCSMVKWTYGRDFHLMLSRTIRHDDVSFWHCTLFTMVICIINCLEKEPLHYPLYYDRHQRENRDETDAFRRYFIAHLQLPGSPYFNYFLEHIMPEKKRYDI